MIDLLWDIPPFLYLTYAALVVYLCEGSILRLLQEFS